MNKKYQVFISSTYVDLIEERKKAIESLLFADCIPAGMESFVASDKEQFEVIKRVIDLCDYYVLIIGGRYGTINEETHLSYTEMEYDYAVSKNIPVLVFCIDNVDKLEATKIEKTTIGKNRLNLFREKALKNRLSSFWSNADDLGAKIICSVMKATKEIQRPGWIRGDEILENEKKEIIKKFTESMLKCVLMINRSATFIEEKDKVCVNLKKVIDSNIFEEYVLNNDVLVSVFIESKFMSSVDVKVEMKLVKQFYDIITDLDSTEAKYIIKNICTKLSSKVTCF